MSDKQILQAVYGELKSSTLTFGVYKNVIKELKLLGISSTNKEIEILHSIILQTNSLQKAIELADNLGESEKSELHEKTRDDFKKEEDRKQAEELKRMQKKQVAEKEAAEKRKAREQELQDMRDQAALSNIYLQISDYQIVGAKNKSELWSQVKDAMGAGWKPWGSMSVYHPGAGIGGVPESFFQAMVKFK